MREEKTNKIIERSSLAKIPFVQQDDDPDHKHENGNLVDDMHGAQVEVFFRGVGISFFKADVVPDFFPDCVHDLRSRS